MCSSCCSWTCPRTPGLEDVLGAAPVDSCCGLTGAAPAEHADEQPGPDRADDHPGSRAALHDGQLPAQRAWSARSFLLHGTPRADARHNAPHAGAGAAPGKACPRAARSAYGPACAGGGLERERAGDQGCSWWLSVVCLAAFPGCACAQVQLSQLQTARWACWAAYAARCVWGMTVGADACCAQQGQSQRQGSQPPGQAQAIQYAAQHLASQLGGYPGASPGAAQGSTAVCCARCRTLQPSAACCAGPHARPPASQPHVWPGSSAGCSNAGARGDSSHSVASCMQAPSPSWAPFPAAWQHLACPRPSPRGTTMTLGSQRRLRSLRPRRTQVSPPRPVLAQPAALPASSAALLQTLEVMQPHEVSNTPGRHRPSQPPRRCACLNGHNGVAWLHVQTKTVPGDAAPAGSRRQQQQQQQQQQPRAGQRLCACRAAADDQSAGQLCCAAGHALPRAPVPGRRRGGALPGGRRSAVKRPAGAPAAGAGPGRVWTAEALGCSWVGRWAGQLGCLPLDRTCRGCTLLLLLRCALHPLSCLSSLLTRPCASLQGPTAPLAASSTPPSTTSSSPTALRRHAKALPAPAYAADTVGQSLLQLTPENCQCNLLRTARAPAQL